MHFFKTKTGIAVVLLCLLAVAGLVWFAVRGDSHRTAPEGTLVEIRVWEASA